MPFNRRTQEQLEAPYTNAVLLRMLEFEEYERGKRRPETIRLIRNLIRVQKEVEQAQATIHQAEEGVA